MLRVAAEHPPQYLDRDDLTFALCEALRKAGRWQELVRAAMFIAKSKSYGPEAYRFGADARIHLQQWKELLADAEARLKAKSNDHAAFESTAIALMGEGRFDEADKTIHRAKEAPYGGYLDDDELQAWDEILEGKVSDATLSKISGGGLMASLNQGSDRLYTVALAQLFSDKTEECQRTLALALEREDPANLPSVAWLVQGELLKRYALEDGADAAFAKARLANNWERVPAAQFLLAKETHRDADAATLTRKQ